MTKLTNDEIAILQHFHRKALELDKAMAHMPEKLSIKAGEQGTEMVGEIGQFETGGFVSITRLFTMEKEDINFHKVRTLIARHYTGDQKKSELLKKYKKVWNDAFGPNPLIGTGAKLNGKEITNGDIYDLVVYGDHSHLDQAKYAELEKLRSEALTLMFVEISFRMVITYIHAIVTMFDRQVVVPLIEDKEWP